MRARCAQYKSTTGYAVAMFDLANAMASSVLAWAFFLFGANAMPTILSFSKYGPVESRSVRCVAAMADANKRLFKRLFWNAFVCFVLFVFLFKQKNMFFGKTFNNPS